jgi:hypothetical protein
MTFAIAPTDQELDSLYAEFQESIKEARRVTFNLALEFFPKENIKPRPIRRVMIEDDSSSSDNVDSGDDDSSEDEEKHVYYDENCSDFDHTKEVYTSDEEDDVILRLMNDLKGTYTPDYSVYEPTLSEEHSDDEEDDEITVFQVHSVMPNQSFDDVKENKIFKSKQPRRQSIFVPVPTTDRKRKADSELDTEPDTKKIKESYPYNVKCISKEFQGFKGLCEDSFENIISFCDDEDIFSFMFLSKQVTDCAVRVLCSRQDTKRKPQYQVDMDILFSKSSFEQLKDMMKYAKSKDVKYYDQISNYVLSYYGEYAHAVATTSDDNDWDVKERDDKEFEALGLSIKNDDWIDVLYYMMRTSFTFGNMWFIKKAIKHDSIHTFRMLVEHGQVQTECWHFERAVKYKSYKVLQELKNHSVISKLLHRQDNKLVYYKIADWLIHKGMKVYDYDLWCANGIVMSTDKFNKAPIKLKHKILKKLHESNVEKNIDAAWHQLDAVSFLINEYVEKTSPKFFDHGKTSSKFLDHTIISMLPELTNQFTSVISDSIIYKMLKDKAAWGIYKYFVETTGYKHSVIEIFLNKRSFIMYDEVFTNLIAEYKIDLKDFGAVHPIMRHGSIELIEIMIIYHSRIHDIMSNNEENFKYISHLMDNKARQILDLLSTHWRCTPAIFKSLVQYAMKSGVYNVEQWGYEQYYNSEGNYAKGLQMLIDKRTNTIRIDLLDALKSVQTELSEQGHAVLHRQALACKLEIEAMIQITKKGDKYWITVGFKADSRKYDKFLGLHVVSITTFNNREYETLCPFYGRFDNEDFKAFNCDPIQYERIIQEDKEQIMVIRVKSARRGSVGSVSVIRDELKCLQVCNIMK